MAKILLCDDSRAIRELVTQALRSAGHEVFEAENGQQGIQLAQQHALDLILTDLNMPLVNGIQLTRQVRDLPTHRQTPILLVTTESQLAKKDQAKAAGASGWVVKPVAPPRLVEIVSQVLARSVAV